MTDETTGTPMTEAGRSLVVEDWDDGVNDRPARRSFGNFNRMADVVAAIETEAWNAALTAVEEAVGGLPTHDYPGAFVRTSTRFRDDLLSRIAALRKGA